jgi:hypothetical protein
MTLAVITVSSPSPAMTTRAQEVQFVARALDLSKAAIRSAGGAVTSGTVIDSGGVTLATWTYTPVASS